MSVCQTEHIDCGKWFLFFLKFSTYVLSFSVWQNGKDLGKFRQLDEILYVEGYPAYQQLMNVAGQQMELVCEVKGHYLTCFIVIAAINVMGAVISVQPTSCFVFID
jgi:hypothetical protein